MSGGCQVRKLKITLGTRATLVHVRRLKIAKLRCACCGEKGFYRGRGSKGYSTAKAVVAQIYVASDVPLGPASDNPRQTAPAVLCGGVWGRREIWKPDCYVAAGEPYGPLIRGVAA